MSESESIVLTPAQNTVPPPSSAPAEREGLPRGYRMRADAHYVDQLEAPAAPVIRLLPPAQIECSDLPPPDQLEALTKSIAVHGVLQPLLIRRRAGGYTLIAGRKRLAAAMAAGVTAIPCLLHDLEEPAAAAIAVADNLRVEESPASAAADRAVARLALHAIASDLATVRNATPLLRSGLSAGVPQRVAMDLVSSQSARAAWLAGCLLGRFDNNRTVALGAIVQRVADSFEANAGVTGLQLECSVTAPAAVCKLPEEAAAAVISGAIHTALCCLDGVRFPRIELNADVPHGRALKIEVVQRSTRVSARVTDLDEPGPGRSAELSLPLALRMTRLVAAAHGATVDLTALPEAGSIVRIAFPGAQSA